MARKILLSLLLFSAFMLPTVLIVLFELQNVFFPILFLPIALELMLSFRLPRKFPGNDVLFGATLCFAGKIIVAVCADFSLPYGSDSTIIIFFLLLASVFCLMFNVMRLKFLKNNSEI